MPVRPRFLLFLADNRLPGFDDRLLIFIGGAGVLHHEEVGVRLAYRFCRIAQAKLLRMSLVDPDEAARSILEVDDVGDTIH